MSNQLINNFENEFIESLVKNSLTYLYDLLSNLNNKEFNFFEKSSKLPTIDETDDDFVNHMYAIIKLELTENNEIIVYYYELNNDMDDIAFNIPLIDLSKSNIVKIANLIAVSEIKDKIKN